MINKVILLGNLGKDPEIRHLESGAAVARFPMATSKNYKDRNGEWQSITTWHDIVAWRQLAERVERDLKKGSLVYVEGEISKRKYQDRDGNDRYAFEVIAYSIRMLDKRDNNPDASSQMASQNTFNEPEGSSSASSEKNDDSFEDDLPF